MQSKIVSVTLLVGHSLQKPFQHIKLLLSGLLIYIAWVTHLLHLYDPQKRSAFKGVTFVATISQIIIFFQNKSLNFSLTRVVCISLHCF